MRAALLAFAFLILASTASAQLDHISAQEAKGHIGESATVCGEVASTRFAQRSKGQPTFLNFDKPYPNEDFTALIWGNDRSKFGTSPERAYRDKAVCVTGRISSYRGTPEIIIREPSQITAER